MTNQTELCDLNDPNEAKFFVRLVNTCNKNSEYTLTAGAPSHEFLDLDDGMIHQGLSSDLADKISEKLNELLETGNDFDKIAFIEKATGPVGMILLSGAILRNVNKEGVIIRPYKLLVRDTIKGEIIKGERVIIISDVATTGETLFEAAEKVWLMGGKVPYVLVVIDRMQGGKENLMRKGITLYSLSSTKAINKLGEQIERPFHESIATLKDFGGTSITFAR